MIDYEGRRDVCDTHTHTGRKPGETDGSGAEPDLTSPVSMSPSLREEDGGATRDVEEEPRVHRRRSVSG